jgi:acyl-CoA dehydrogenase
MDFEFSAEQEMLRSSVRAFLEAHAPLALVRATYETGHVDRTLWEGLADLGVLDLGMVDSAVVLEELGRALSPVPFVSSAMSARALYPGLARTSTIGTIAVYEAGRRYDWRTPRCRATRSNGDWALDGEKVHVPDASGADVFVVTATDERGDLGVFVTAAATVDPTETIDGSRPQGRTRFKHAAAQRLDAGADEVAQALDRLGVAVVVDGVGAADRALELAVQYAHERVQFGKPIGSFQAVQHLCADMLRTVELGRAAGYYACWALDDAPPDEAHRAATLARAFAADAFPALGATAIQVFGGVGFTWEHDIHLYYKRLVGQSVALGTVSDHLEELANIAIR